RPLLTSPEMRSEEAATHVLLQSGWQVERGPDSVLVSYPVSRVGRIVAWLILIFLVCPLVPFLFLFASGRRMLGDLWADANGAPPPRAYYEIRAGSIETRTVRGDEVRERSVIDGADLLGIVYGPSLTWSKHEMKRVDPSLSLVSTGGQVTLGVPPQLGSAVRDLITAATVRLRTERPELGLLAGPSPTRCPWCSQLYVLEPGARCPSCGAPGLLQ
ncbi:MAG: hypothetical protein H6719_35595, partial [Sandaracinaceae bacterium]|nr:hypothetical protein [Sandaracinaceae bacterium]